MHPAVLAVIAICCGPGVGNCGCDHVKSSSPAPTYQWVLTAPATWALAGTKVSIEYQLVTDNFEVRWGSVSHYKNTLIEAMDDGTSMAVKLQSYGVTP